MSQGKTSLFAVSHRMKRVVVFLRGKEEVVSALTEIQDFEFDCFDVSPGLIK